MKLEILQLKLIILNLIILIIYNDHKCFVEIQTLKFFMNVFNYYEF